jgi:hypothetical protein
MKTGKIELEYYLHGIRPLEAIPDRLYTTYSSTAPLPGKQTEVLDESTPQNLRVKFTNKQKAITAANLMLSLALLHQFSRANRRTLSVPERLKHMKQGHKN